MRRKKQRNLLIIVIVMLGALLTVPEYSVNAAAPQNNYQQIAMQQDRMLIHDLAQYVGNTVVDWSTVEILGLPRHGTASISSTGILTYTPGAFETQDVSIVWRVKGVGADNFLPEQVLTIQIAPFAPETLSNLKLHLNDSVGLYQDAEGRTPASNPGDPIGFWEDQSGQGHHAVQSITTHRPTYQVDGISFTAAGSTNVTSSYLTNDLSWLTNTDYTLSFVFSLKTLPLSVSDNRPLLGSDDGTVSSNLHVRFDENNILRIDDWGTGQESLYTFTPEPDDLTILTLRHNGSGRDVWIDGLKIGGDADDDLLLSFANGNIGRMHWYDGNWYYFDGTIRRVLGYDRALNDGEIAQLHHMMSHDYAIPVADGSGALLHPTFRPLLYQLTPGFVDQFNGNNLDTNKWRLPESRPGAYWFSGHDVNWGNVPTMASGREFALAKDDMISVSDGLLSLTIDALSPGETRFNPLQDEDFTFNYQSASVSTYNHYNFTYGYLEFRAKLADASGSWDALWTLGTYTRDWPERGEIDVMEQFGGSQATNNNLSNNSQVQLTLHYVEIPGTPKADLKGEFGINDPFRGGDTRFGWNAFTEGFHTFAVYWTPDVIHWIVDGVIRYTVEGEINIPDEAQTIILSTMINSDLVNPPDYPSSMLVDYVVAYEFATPPAVNVGG